MTRANAKMIRRATGEELLLLAIFQGERIKPAINRELDRRASQRSAIEQSGLLVDYPITDRAA